VHEFVEIQNTSGATVDLGGLDACGRHQLHVPTNTAIASGAFRVIAKNPARLRDGLFAHSVQCARCYSGYLGNGSDTVRVKNSGAIRLMR